MEAKNEKIKEETLLFVEHNTHEGKVSSGPRKGQDYIMHILTDAQGRDFTTFNSAFAVIDTPQKIKYREFEDENGYTKRQILDPEPLDEVQEEDPDTGEKTVTKRAFTRLEEMEERVMGANRETYKLLKSIAKRLEEIPDLSGIVKEREEVDPDEIPF